MADSSPRLSPPDTPSPETEWYATGPERRLGGEI